MNTVGCVVMLDISSSMASAIDLVKIDAKAFVRCFLGEDQFGVNQFSDSAKWLYPSGTDPDIVTVSPFGQETKAAADAIETIYPTGCTNIGEAIALGNQMIGKAKTDVKAFALFSDGQHNTGERPETILKNEPPIHIAALGQWMKKEYFEPLLAKNAKSTFYNSPNAVEVMKMFNHMRTDSVEGILLQNDFEKYQQGSDYLLKTFTVPADSTENQLSVVWTNKKYHYTSGSLQKDCFNVILVDPDERTTDIRPDIADDGFCIFNLKNVKPGQWKVLIQYGQLVGDMGGTFGAISLDSSLNVNVTSPYTGQVGEPLRFGVEVLKGKKKLENLTVNAKIRRPLLSMEQALRMFRNELSGISIPETAVREEDMERLRLHMLCMQKGSTFLDKTFTHQNVKLNELQDGGYEYQTEAVQIPGVYQAEFQISGTDPETKAPFSCVKTQAVLV